MKVYIKAVKSPFHLSLLLLKSISEEFRIKFFFRENIWTRSSTHKFAESWTLSTSDDYNFHFALFYICSKSIQMRSVQFPVLGAWNKNAIYFCFQCEKPLYASDWISKRSIEQRYFIFNLKYSQWNSPERCEFFIEFWMFFNFLLENMR